MMAALVCAVKWIQPTLAWVISSLRAPKSMEGYRSIGGGSPLRRITNEQAKAIAAQLEARGQPANVYVAMRYWKPFTEDAMEQVRQWAWSLSQQEQTAVQLQAALSLHKH